MDHQLAYVTVGSLEASISNNQDAAGENSYEMWWGGRTSPDEWSRVGGQLFVDVISPHGRRTLIGIVGLVLAESDTPIDWVAFLFPLVFAESCAVHPDFADPDKISANREFLEHACAPDQTLTIGYGRSPVQVTMCPPFFVSERERKSEILELLKFLSGKNPFFVQDELMAGVQDAFFGTAHWIGSYLGHADWFCQTFRQSVEGVASESGQVDVKEFLQMRVDAQRLIERTSKERTQLDCGSDYDVFLSHFHGDSDCADVIERALLTVWPMLRVFRTRAGETEQRGSEISLGFLEAARRSRCIVFVATPNSLGRPFVRQELGNNALRPICTLLVDVRREDFEAQRRRELHVAYDPSRIFEVQAEAGWRQFFDEIPRILGSNFENAAPPSDVLCAGPPSPRTELEEGASYLAWAERTRR